MRRAKKASIAIIFVTIIVVAAATATGVYVATSTGSSSSSPATPFITVSNNQLVNSQGQPTRLIGVDIAESQYYCLGRHPGPFPMPINSASINGLVSWHINAVRILIVEDCWLGIDGEPHSSTATAYRKSLESVVSMLNARHIEVILALVATKLVLGTGKHSDATGSNPSPGGPTTRDYEMADAANAPTLWSSVASTFLHSPGVMYDLFGEPQFITWSCWESGCTVGGLQVTGMQELVNAIRATGSHQPLLVGGIGYANDLSEWLAHEPKDPDHQLIASIHVYPWTHCSDAACWNDTIKPVSAKVPVVTGEFGALHCDTPFVKKYMRWADKHTVSYLLWSWLQGTCSSSPGAMPIVTSYSGTPTSYGAVFMDHVLALFQAGKGDAGAISSLVGPNSKGAGGGSGSKKHKKSSKS